MVILRFVLINIVATGDTLAEAITDAAYSIIEKNTKGFMIAGICGVN